MHRPVNANDGVVVLLSALAFVAAAAWAKQPLPPAWAFGTAQIPIMIVTAQDLSAADRQRLNGHIMDIVGKATDFNQGRFAQEVQRTLSRPTARPTVHS